MIPILARAARRAPQTHLPALHLGRESAADAPAGRADRAQQSPRASPCRRPDGQASRRIWRRWSFRKAPTNSRARRCPSCSRKAPGPRAPLLGEDSERAKKFEQRRREVWRQYRDGARAGRGLSPVHPGAGLHLPRHATFARSTSRSRPADAEHHPFRARARSIGRTTGSTCICRDCAGTSFRRSIFIRAGVRTAPARHRTLVEMLDRAAERYGSRPALVARQPSGERVTHDLPRAARQRASRRTAARDARGQAGRPCAAHRRELARLGARVFRDSLRRRRRGAARPSDFARGARADLPHRHAFGSAVLGGGRKTRRQRIGRDGQRHRRTRVCGAQPSVRPARDGPTRGPPPSARRSRRSSSPRAPPARPRA